MQTRLVFNIVLLSIAIQFASCVPLNVSPTPESAPPPVCEDVVDKRLLFFPFATASNPTILSWIRDQYGVAEKDISISHRPPTVELPDYWEWEMDWRFSGRDYGVGFLVSGQPKAVVTIQWPNATLTLQDVLRCLGQPAAYHAYYQYYPEAIWTVIDVIYPEAGLVVHGFMQRKTSQLDERIPMRLITYAEPGSIESFLEHAFSLKQGSALHSKMLSKFRPWPGDITKITIDERG